MTDPLAGGGKAINLHRLAAPIWQRYRLSEQAILVAERAMRDDPRRAWACYAAIARSLEPR